MGFSLDEVTERLGRIADGVGEFVVETGNTTVDLVTGYDLAERGRVRGAQDAGNAQRDDIYDAQDELRGRFTGGWDAEQFVEESFDSMSHQQIMASVNRMNPAAVTASAQGWTAIGSALAEGLDGFKAALLAEIGAGWEGEAAASASGATADYVRASDELAAAGSLVGSKVAEAATGITQVKATVPPPQHTSFAEALFDLVSPETALIKSMLHERNEAREQAVQIMKSVYSPVMRQADRRVPTLPSPLDVARPGVDGPAGGTAAGGDRVGPEETGFPPARVPFPSGVAVPDRSAGSGSEGVGGQAADLGIGSGGDPAGGTAADAGAATVGADPYAVAPPAVDPYAVDPYAVDPHRADPNSGTSDGETATDAATARPDRAPAWTHPAGAEVGGVGGPGTSAGPGAAGGSTGYGAPGPGGSGGSGSGAGGGAYGGSGSGGSGSGAGGANGGGLAGGGVYGGGTTGGPGAAATTPAGAVSAVTGVGGAGRAALPGAAMMPAAARGGGGDDAEHATPGYLVTVDNGNEVVGALPLVAPPVLGA